VSQETAEAKRKKRKRRNINNVKGGGFEALPYDDISEKKPQAAFRRQAKRRQNRA